MMHQVPVYTHQVHIYETSGNFKSKKKIEKKINIIEVHSEPIVPPINLRGLYWSFTFIQTWK